MKKINFLLTLLCVSYISFGQTQGTFSGDFMMNMNFFMRDTSIKASGNPLYNNYLSGNEAWLDLRYTVDGFNFFARADVFDNSNLKVPTQAMSGFGIGAWSISKEFEGLTITAGYIYDQIGSGILFRAYEDRGLLIDNAVEGVELKYKLAPNITIKGFAGQQKNVFQLYAPVVKGFNAEGDFTVGKVHLSPGIGILNRTLDQNNMDAIVSNINSQPLASRFVPVYNVYAGTVYNHLTYKNFSWYVEGAYKSHEAIYTDSANTLVDKPGNVEYTTLNYARKGMAINFAGKRTEDFVMQTYPNATASPGQDIMNWQPIMAIMRTERLISRYTPISESVSEQAAIGSLLLSPSDVTNITVNYTQINKLDNTKLYREGWAEVLYQGIDKWIIQLGAQYMEYNIFIYQNETPTLPHMVYAVTPFTELTYRINDKKSVRFEGQWMDSKQDYGSWVFALLEFNFAPKFSISASDMYNYDPNLEKVSKANHYYNIYTAYTKGPHRFSLAYVKQVDGINCSGGVCRYEPAFSGVKATCTSSF